jgi:hypothetical protein
MSIHEDPTAKDWKHLKGAICNPDRTDEQQEAVNKFCEMMDETVAWLNSPEVKAFVGEK